MMMRWSIKHVHHVQNNQCDMLLHHRYKLTIFSLEPLKPALLVLRYVISELWGSNTLHSSYNVVKCHIGKKDMPVSSDIWNEV